MTRVPILAAVAVAAVGTACGDFRVPLFEVAPPASSSDGAGTAAFAPVRYEAEAIPPNVLIRGAIVDDTCFATGNVCPSGGLEEGADCCSNGGVVTALLGRVPCGGPAGDAGDYVDCQDIGAGVEFHGIVVPADGSYDVTWWYHCGEAGSSGVADTYGDTACGGLDYDTGPGTGCRPHLIDVDGVPVSTTLDGAAATIYQFPCYGDAWSVVHAATTALPLKAGANVIYIHAPHATNLDGSDIDAIDVLLAGQGARPLVTPVVSGD